MGATVALVRSTQSMDEIRKSISKALNLIGFKPKRNTVESLVIKANLCYYWKPDTGSTTDPRVVAGIIDCFRERFGPKIRIQVAEADASAMRTKHSFLMLGYEDLARKKNVELLNLSEDTMKNQEILVNGHKLTFAIPQSLLDCDLFVNVPKLKVMRATRISCALKNIFGCIGLPRKFKYHPVLNEAIVGINKILHTDLTIVDGLVVLGRFPTRLGLLMASVDPFSIDWVASRIAGYNPGGIGFLRIAQKEQLGHKKGIITVGEDPGLFEREFPKENFFFRKWAWDLQFRLLRAYCKIVGDVVPPVLENI